MAGIRVGTGTVHLPSHPCVVAWSSTVGKKEGQGPLGDLFDVILQDDTLGEKSWEFAESRYYQDTVRRCLAKANIQPKDVDFLLGGDLLNQIISASFAARGLGIPFIGLYGACSTMSESLALGAMLIEGGCARRVVCAASSHFSSAERQFRFPLEMGGQRVPSAQWTVTGAGATLLCTAPLAQSPAAVITHVTMGKVVDLGISDANNMGAAMAPAAGDNPTVPRARGGPLANRAPNTGAAARAPAAADTLYTHLMDTGRRPSDYDMIITGDLGMVGHALLQELMRDKGMPLNPDRYIDCGLMIFGPTQDVHAGGSGCGCSASVLNSDILGRFAQRKMGRALFMATGALMSSTSSLQGETIPGVAHAVALEIPEGVGPR